MESLMKKKLFSLILSLFLFVSNASADVSHLLISVSTGYPPFYFFTEDKQPAGICIDIIDQVAQKMGIAVEYVSYPWKRMLQYGRAGEVDAILPLFQTAEREQFLYFPAEALAIEENRFFTSTSSALEYSGRLADIIDHSVGVIDDYSYGREFDNLKFSGKTVVMSQEQLIRLVLHQRVDFGIGNSKVIRYAAQRMGNAEQLRFLSPPVTSEPLFIGFSKKKIGPDFVARFTEALHEFKSTDAYFAILRTYGL